MSIFYNKCKIFYVLTTANLNSLLAPGKQEILLKSFTIFNKLFENNFRFIIHTKFKVVAQNLFKGGFFNIMKLNNIAWLRNITSLCLMFTIFTATSLIVAAAPEKDSSKGELVVSGKYVNGAQPSVTLNGEQAFNGRTFFSSGTVITPKDTNAVLKLGNLGYINVAPDSVLSVNFKKNSISGTLSAGNIKVVNNEGVEVKIHTADKNFTNKAGGNGVFTISFNSDIATATSEAGSLYVTDGVNTVPVQDDDDKGSISNGSAAVPVLVLGGIVAFAAIYIFTNGDDNNGVFVSGTN